ncbi:hypothetical protein K2X83_00725 [Patescibacteria group bacterium]|nr:hypothetical protein [Patescibacteria group bacterium]
MTTQAVEKAKKVPTRRELVQARIKEISSQLPLVKNVRWTRGAVIATTKLLFDEFGFFTLSDIEKTRLYQAVKQTEDGLEGIAQEAGVDYKALYAQNVKSVQKWDRASVLIALQERNRQKLSMKKHAIDADNPGLVHAARRYFSEDAKALGVGPLEAAFRVAGVRDGASKRDLAPMKGRWSRDQRALLFMRSLLESGAGNEKFQLHVFYELAERLNAAGYRARNEGKPIHKNSIQDFFMRGIGKSTFTISDMTTYLNSMLATAELTNTDRVQVSKDLSSTEKRPLGKVKLPDWTKNQIAVALLFSGRAMGIAYKHIEREIASNTTVTGAGAMSLRDFFAAHGADDSSSFGVTEKQMETARASFTSGDLRSKTKKVLPPEKNSRSRKKLKAKKSPPKPEYIQNSKYNPRVSGTAIEVDWHDEESPAWVPIVAYIDRGVPNDQHGIFSSVLQKMGFIKDGHGTAAKTFRDFVRNRFQTSDSREVNYALFERKARERAERLRSLDPDTALRLEEDAAQHFEELERKLAERGLSMILKRGD